MTTYRRAWTMRLREGAEADYDAAHAAIWPDLVAQMKADGIEFYVLFREGTTVFAVQERATPFPARDRPPTPVTQRWWAAMSGLMVTDEADRPLQTELQEVFALTPPKGHA